MTSIYVCAARCPVPSHRLKTVANEWTTMRVRLFSFAYYTPEVPTRSSPVPLPIAPRPGLMKCNRAWRIEHQTPPHPAVLPAMSRLLVFPLAMPRTAAHQAHPCMHAVMLDVQSSIPPSPPPPHRSRRATANSPSCRFISSYLRVASCSSSCMSSCIRACSWLCIASCAPCP